MEVELKRVKLLSVRQERIGSVILETDAGIFMLDNTGKLGLTADPNFVNQQGKPQVVRVEFNMYNFPD